MIFTVSEDKEMLIMRLFYLVCCSCVILSLAGCAGNRTFGQFYQSRAVERSFRNFEISERYNYYYNGREKMPDAILGLRKDYVMQSTFWHPVDLTASKMAVWWQEIRFDWYSSLGGSLERVGSNGWILKAPNGDEVGILFSKYSLVAAEFSHGKVVTVNIPQPRTEIYERPWHSN